MHLFTLRVLYGHKGMSFKYSNPFASNKVEKKILNTVVVDDQHGFHPSKGTVTN